MLLAYLKGFLRNLRRHFSKISIHGLSNMFRSKGIWETVFWAFIFLASIYYSRLLLYSNIVDFMYQAVVKTIDTLAYPVSLVPFPAVTVCNFNAVFKSRAAPIVQLLVDNGVDEELARSFLKDLANLRTPTYVPPNKYERVYEVLRSSGYKSNSGFMRAVAQPCDDLVRYCSWAGQQVQCSQIFAESKADIGLCCSFNSHLFPVHKSAQQDYYTSGGARAGLNLQLNLALEEYVSSAYNATAILVFVHEQNTYPDNSAFFALIEPNKAFSLKISPDVYEADEDLRRVKLRSRRCLFDGEGFKFFGQNYSFANCMELCKTYAVGSLCNCVPDNFPDTYEWRSCTLSDVNCLRAHQDNYTALSMRLNVLDNNKDKIICDCLPSCSGVQYTGAVESLAIRGSNQNGNLSFVRVFFQDNWCFKYSLSRSIRGEAMLAVVGGFFGLCFGGSLLSGVEFPYYLLKSLYVKRGGLRSAEPAPRIYWAELGTRPRKIAPKRPVLYDNYLKEFIN